MTGTLVIGAGVVGVATAYALAARGHSVAVIEQEPGPGRGASFANGAQLSYAYADALGSPGLLRQMPRLLLGRDAAGALRRPFPPRLVGWAAGLLRNCTRGRFVRNTAAVATLADESQRALHRLLARHPLAFEHSRAGKMHLYFDERSLRAARNSVALKARLGIEQALLSAAEAVEREPALAALGVRLSGAIYSPHDEAGDPHLFCVEMTRLLQASYGVRFHFGERVRALCVQGGAVVAVETATRRYLADRVVVCLGIDSAALLRTAGIRAPLCPMKGYSVTLPAGDAAPRISITDVAGRIVLCRLGERLRIAGFAGIGMDDTRIEERRIEALVARARAIFPRAAVYDAPRAAWAGLRPMTASSVPIIGATRIGGLYLNIGHGMLGWTLAMGSAERAASAMTAGQGAAGG